MSQVAIEHKSASVYDNLPEGETKPAEGEGLNMPTRVTLLGVFPKAEKPSAEQKRSYEEKVRRNTEKIGEYCVPLGWGKGPLWAVYLSLFKNLRDSGDRYVRGDRMVSTLG